MKRHSQKTNFRRRGYVLFLVLGTVAVLCMVAAQVLSYNSSSYRAMHRAANWREAMVTAEAGVDIAIAEITQILPDVRLNSQEGLGLSLPTSLPSLGLGLSLQPGSGGLPLNLAVTLTPPPLQKTGEGSNLQQAYVSIEVLPLDATLSSLLNLSGDQLSLQLVRVRSTGISYLDYGKTAGYEKEDNRLRRPVLDFDVAKGAKVARPFVSRTVEVTLRPTFAFQTGLVCQGSFQADDPNAVFDSFNSTTALTSTNRRYDLVKRLSNAAVGTNSSQLQLAGRVYGNVSSNGANFEKTERITGRVNNQRYQTLTLLKAPTWSGSPLAPSRITGNTTLSAGSFLLPARFKFTEITGNLHINRGLLGLGTNVDIYVTGDFTGTLRIDDGVKARVYVAGSIDTGAGAWRNDSRIASNLQIFGVRNNTDAETMKFSLGSDMEAAIYAPEHQLVFSQSGNFSGSLVGASLWVKSAAKFHYDEALALNLGPILRYDLASWREVVPED